jgi:lambda repressor-like predicted transcriptional regulator
MPKKTAHADWSWKYLLHRLDEAGWNLTRLAAHHGIRIGGLNDTKRKSYPANERRLAEAIGVHPKAIWPSRYHPDGRHKLRGEDRSRQKGQKVAGKSTPGVPAYKVNIHETEVM